MGQLLTSLREMDAERNEASAYGDYLVVVTSLLLAKKVQLDSRKKDIRSQ